MIINDIKKELERLSIKPDKALGQNFLINEEIYKKIIAIAEVKPSDTIIEVGPGLGTFTEYLAGAAKKIIAVEKDRELATYLKNRFKNTNIEIVEQDILEFSPTNYKLADGTYKLIGNIPYYLTSHLIKIIFENWPKPESIVFMVQKEIAQRMAAKPPQMTMLSVLVQFYSKTEIACWVSKGNFYPMPKVDSAIIRLKPMARQLPPDYSKKIFRVAGAGFSEKRKQLVNTLSKGLKISKKEIEIKLLSAGIMPKRRAETLTIEEWQRLTEAIY